MPMVQYWKNKESVQAKVTTNEDGATIMIMEGEKEPFPGFPRGYILLADKGEYSHFSKIKHRIKNELFNESWTLLEAGRDNEVWPEVKRKLTKIFEMVEPVRYDMVPPSRMVKAVKEIWRAFETLEKESELVKPLKELLTFILMEDDAYRFRVQWLATVMNPFSWWFKWFGNPIKDFDLALEEMINAEVVGDMKDKIKLLRRVLMCILKDKRLSELFNKFMKELDWNKVKLDRSDKYHFRGKYFKVDWTLFEY